MLREPTPPKVRPSQCPKCRLVETLCVCALAPKFDLATRVVVVIHVREWNRSSNTGHLVQMTLPNSLVRLHGIKPPALDGTEGATAAATDHELLRNDGGGAVLALYPGCGAKELTPSFLKTLKRPVTLLVPDGNWSQARNMMRRLPLFQNATPVCLPGPVLDVLRPRRNAFADRMSTFEAIAQALGVLESQAAETALLDYFRYIADRQLLLRGKLKAAAMYRGEGGS